MPYKDPDKQRNYQKLWARRQEGTSTKQCKLSKIKIRKWFREYKKQYKCKTCPESDPRCIDFHHRNPKTKIMTVSRMTVCGYSKEKILKEIKKCDPFCSNCHRKITVKYADL